MPPRKASGWTRTCNSSPPAISQTLDIPVLLGRDFTDRDDKGTPPVALVNERFAKRYFAGRSPVGLHVGMGGNPGTKTDIEIVGVVKDTRYESMRDEVPYELYRPYRQMDFVQGMTVYARAQGDPTAIFASMRQTVNELDSNVPIYRMRTLEQQLDKSLMSERLLASLSRVFGLLATLLAAIGLYGVMAYMVVRRTREIGIRMALGANRGSVVWLVMREVLVLSAIGVAIGGAGAYAATRLVQKRSSSASCPPTRSPWCSRRSASPRWRSSRDTSPPAAPPPSTRCSPCAGSEPEMLQ